jgi:hypothetical protein
VDRGLLREAVDAPRVNGLFWDCVVRGNELSLVTAGRPSATGSLLISIEKPWEAMVG